MSRSFIIVIDSLGLGEAQDATNFGDIGANTLDHITKHCAMGKIDHGCNPTRPGSDHTRVNIAAIMFGSDVLAVSHGRPDTFADIGQTVTSQPGLTALDYGTNCFSGYWV